MLYVTDAGFIFLDVVDFYVNFIMILTGFFECFCAGWMFEIDQQFEKLGRPAVFLYQFSTFASVIVASVLWFAAENIRNLMAGFVALAVIYGAGLIGVVVMLGMRVHSHENLSTKSALYHLFFANIFHLKRELSETVGYLPYGWIILVKHLIPQLLLILFINLAAAKTGTGR